MYAPATQVCVTWHVRVTVSPPIIQWRSMPRPSERNPYSESIRR